PRSWHVLRDDRWAAGKMPRQKFGHEPAVNVVAPARPITYQHAQRFAAIEIRDGLSLDRHRCDDADRNNNYSRYAPAARSFLHSAWKTLFTHHSASSMPVGNQRSPAFFICSMMPRRASVRPGRPMM